MEDSFVVSKMIESFEISDYYTEVYDEEEILNFSNFLNFVKIEKGIRLPLIPIIDLWKLFMAERLDCISCGFNKEYTDEFIQKLEKWAKEAYDACYS